MKLCQACNTEKPETDFYRDNSRADKLNWRCKICHKAHVAKIAMQPPKNPAPEGMKRCSRCKEILPVEEFVADKNYYDGKARACKKCHYGRHKEWSQKNPGYIAAFQKKNRQKNLERFRDYERRQNYGLKPGEFQEMLVAQDGRCAICGTDSPAPRTAFCVDHCHDTKQVRGLLCNKCNTGIGNLQHNVEILASAIRYLSKNSSI